MCIYTWFKVNVHCLNVYPHRCKQGDHSWNFNSTPLVPHVCVGELAIGQHWIRWWLVAWSTKPLPKPILTYQQSDPYIRNKLQWNLNQNTNVSFMKTRLKMSSGKWRSYCLERPQSINVPNFVEITKRLLHGAIICLLRVILGKVMAWHYQEMTILWSNSQFR